MICIVWAGGKGVQVQPGSRGRGCVFITWHWMKTLPISFAADDAGWRDETTDDVILLFSVDDEQLEIYVNMSGFWSDCCQVSRRHPSPGRWTRRNLDHVRCTKSSLQGMYCTPWPRNQSWRPVNLQLHPVGQKEDFLRFSGNRFHLADFCVFERKNQMRD